MAVESLIKLGPGKHHKKVRAVVKTVRTYNRWYFYKIKQPILLIKFLRQFSWVDGKSLKQLKFEVIKKKSGTN